MGLIAGKDISRMSTTDNKIAEVLAKFGEPMAGNVWRVQGAVVIYHKALERIAAQAQIQFEPPTIAIITPSTSMQNAFSSEPPARTMASTRPSSISAK